MIEIERKFLVENEDYKKLAVKKTYFVQAYLNTHPERTTRIRIAGDKAFITIKGKSSASGLSRFEWEKEIPVEDAKELLELCEPGAIEKYRYIIPLEELFYEVDEFLGNLKGLTIAEIELKKEDDSFKKFDWLGKEVTGDPDYYNSNLIKRSIKI
ncbi:CYTH domain-containing protein [Gramella sp. AN32]|uniref:CYTH domain-containing protein n=1 Tax=Christiangramia antarctica TaxID=2058158 RepID=A0ABW5X205_9FLAO|nr:CYTH domain-containing protein [Gramella sp. AN32]MCM4154911.1 adenylate cyclase [Gramella sp. AN32]